MANSKRQFPGQAFGVARLQRGDQRPGGGQRLQQFAHGPALDDGEVVLNDLAANHAVDERLVGVPCPHPVFACLYACRASRHVGRQLEQPRTIQDHAFFQPRGHCVQRVSGFDDHGPARRSGSKGILQRQACGVQPGKHEQGRRGHPGNHGLGFAGHSDDRS